ncbi:hypothetical protein BD779DRAFT_1503933 [Infundibulicybe gibba]|nr:hypothetical protein BD779DRAFT_1503933 [Infundibulicybe gibba]
MMVTLESFANELLLEVARHLPLEDAFPFLLLSRRFYALSKERGFWIAILRMTVLTTPLFSPSYMDMTLCNLDELKYIAIRTRRREQNWNRPEIKIIGPTKTIICDGPHSLIFQAPGTEFLILHAAERGVAVCLKADSATLISSVYVGPSIFGQSPPHEQMGKYSIALLTSDVPHNPDNSPTRLMVLTFVMSTSHDTAELSATFNHELSQDYNHRDPFLNSEIVGALRLFDSTNLEILAFNLNTNQAAVLQSDTLYDAQIGSVSLGGDLYIVRDHRETSYVHFCPNRLLPYESISKPNNYRFFLNCDDVPPLIWHGIDASFFGCDIWFEPLGILNPDPMAKIPVVTLHHIFVDDEQTPRVVNIRFWTSRPKDPEYGSPSYLAPAHAINVHGMLRSPSRGSSRLYTSSGYHVLLMIENRGVLSLQLVRYKPTVPSSSIHSLEIPPSIELDSITGLSVDDHLGVIYLMDSSRLLLRIPYA